MNRVRPIGLGLLALGLAGYSYGVFNPYPGRAFSVTVVMVGVALVAMRGAFEPEGSER